MYSHYQDALSICRVYGNPYYFITFTCNVKWPKISHYMDVHGQYDTNNRVDIIARVFEIKVDAFIKFLKEDKTFGEVDTCTYTFYSAYISICLWLYIHLVSLNFVLVLQISIL